MFPSSPGSSRRGEKTAAVPVELEPARPPNAYTAIASVATAKQMQVSGRMFGPTRLPRSSDFGEPLWAIRWPNTARNVAVSRCMRTSGFPCGLPHYPAPCSPRCLLSLYSINPPFFTGRENTTERKGSVDGFILKSSTTCHPPCAGGAPAETRVRWLEDLPSAGAKGVPGACPSAYVSARASRLLGFALCARHPPYNLSD